LEQCVLIGPEQAQVIRSAAFHEAQKIGVIDNLAGVRIFKIDADLHLVAPIANFAVERGCQSAIPVIVIPRISMSASGARDLSTDA
jgi:hypothetical protein